MDKESFRRAKSFLFSDISRELQLARAHASIGGSDALQSANILPGGGNFLAALGLLCYTEFGGKLKYNAKTDSDNFTFFFNDLGPSYKAFTDSGERPYKTFRCGMVHEYNVKAPCSIAMLGQNAPCGIGRTPDGAYWFVVERYFLDLQSAFEMLGGSLFP
jgi:hypothetical protein